MDLFNQNISFDSENYLLVEENLAHVPATQSFTFMGWLKIDFQNSDLEPVFKLSQKDFSSHNSPVLTNSQVLAQLERVKSIKGYNLRLVYLYS